MKMVQSIHLTSLYLCVGFFFSPLWLGVTHCNFPELLWRSSLLICDACPASAPLRGWVMGSTCLAHPKPGCRARQWCGAAVPSQEIGLGQPWHWGAVGRDAALVVGLLVLREPKVLLFCFFYCVLCSLWMLSFGKQECSGKTSGAAGWEENRISNWFEWE